MLLPGQNNMPKSRPAARRIAYSTRCPEGLRRLSSTFSEHGDVKRAQRCLEAPMRETLPQRPMRVKTLASRAARGSCCAST